MANRRLAQGFLAGAPPWALKRGTLVVVPSLSLGNDELLAESGANPAAEQRLLPLALMLTSPEVRVVYASSYPTPDPIVDAVLGHLPAGARERLTMITTARPGPLARALGDDPTALAQLREAIDRSEPACLISFDVTSHEMGLAARLGIPVIGSEPELQSLCTKSGARRLAGKIGVPIPPGCEDLGSLSDVEAALDSLGPQHPRVIVKLNDGFGGLGNVVVDSSQPGVPLRERSVRFGDPLDDWDLFAEKLVRAGGVVEAMVGKGALASPSAQLYISPEGDASVISTQDQIMGGPTGQTCIGCAGPASLRYRHTITRHATTVGRALADAGVWGFVGVDFLAEPASYGSRVYLGEINLRMGATAPPNLLFRMLLEAHGGEVADQEDGSPSYVARGVRLPEGGLPGNLSFSRVTGRGIFPFGVDPRDPSRTTVLAVGATRREALGLLERAAQS